MDAIESLRPTEKGRVMDLVKHAGLDVSDWANFARGAAWAAANPRYCYEWSFVDPGRVVVVSLWHRDLRENKGVVSWASNPREWFRQSSHQAMVGVRKNRAEKLHLALREAARGHLPVRVIVNDSTMRGADDSKGKASTVQKRLLDPVPWAVTAYSDKTGDITLTRGVATKRSVDQFEVVQDLDDTPRRVNVNSSAFVRDAALRAAALLRADGKCELCGCSGFATADGRIYLETHHVVPLSEGGHDSADNIAAVCPNHHREAHHGSRAEAIRETLQQLLRSKRRAV